MNLIPPTFRARQAGFSMIELMIALLIGLFLLGGISIMVQDNKRTSSSQVALSKLQDYERVAMTMLTDVIQQGGYFPDPTSNSASTLFQPTNVLYGGSEYASQVGFTTNGQVIFGYHNVTSPINVLSSSDSIEVLFVTASGDGILNCFGQSNTTGANKSEADYFFTFNGQLWCENEVPTATPLVGDGYGSGASNPVNITSMQILYGVNSAGTASNGVDTYKNAAQMTSADWSNLISVQVTLTFTNPLYSASNPGQPATVSISRVISVMNQTGI
jgi:type IV pilus assembly protein PilW